MSSNSDSDSESNHSRSPQRNTAPTPGRDSDRSASNSPTSHKESPDQASQASGSRSGSAASNRSRSGSRSRSNTPQSHRSNRSGESRKSRSRSVASQRSGSHKSGSEKSRTPSGGSQRSGSASRRSGSGSRSGSAASNRSRSGTPASKSSKGSRSRSASRSRSRSKSAASQRSKSTARSGSASPNLQIDEPESPGSKKSDSPGDKEAKRKTRVLDSDSDGEQAEKEGKSTVEAADIFGDADDISSEEEKEAETEKKESDKEQEAERSEGEERDRERAGSDEENESQHERDDDEDKENEPEPIPETRIDVEIPKISCDLGKEINFVKLPNFLSVETRPFDPETYEDEIDEEETLDEEGRARLKLKVENTIRWRETMDDEGNMKKESNARFVKWSDGSYSLHLGSEIFDVYKQPLQGDHNHLFIRQGTGLQGQAVFRTKLSFRPHSTESFTHRKMTLSLADRSQKTSGIKILSQVGADPDADRATLLKKEEEKLKQVTRASKPRRSGGSRSHVSSNVYREEEGSEDEGAISLNAIKNKYKSGAMTATKGGAIYSSDEEGSDIEDRRARKLDKPRALKDSDSGESD